MEYKFFRNILNKQIFESSKSDLFEKLSKYPERYIGLFRSTKTKILQNLLQSNEIRFGDALEIIAGRFTAVKFGQPPQCGILLYNRVP